MQTGLLLANPTGPSGYDVIALVVAGLGLVLGVASLTWNFTAFRLSGPRIKVHLKIGAIGNGGIVSKRGPQPPDWQQLVKQGWTEPLIGVEVVNVGRTATDVDGFSCDFADGFGFTNPGLPYNPSMPLRLEPHTAKDLWLPLRDVVAVPEAARASGLSSGRARGSMSVKVAGPKTYRTQSFTL